MNRSNRHASLLVLRCPSADARPRQWQETGNKATWRSLVLLTKHVSHEGQPRTKQRKHRSDAPMNSRVRTTAPRHTPTPVAVPPAFLKAPECPQPFHTHVQALPSEGYQARDIEKKERWSLLSQLHILLLRHQRILQVLCLLAFKPFLTLCPRLSTDPSCFGCRRRADLFRRGRLWRNERPSSRYTRSTRLWLSRQPSRRSITYTRGAP